MPLKLNVGLSKKIGQPNYGSLGASCNMEVELDSLLLHNDVEGFHHRVRQAFTACRQAVQDELSRLSGPTADIDDAGHDATTTSNGNHAEAQTGGAGSGYRVTRKQLEYAQLLAGQIRGLGVRRLEAFADRLFSKPLADLSSVEGSGLIDELKAIKAGVIELDEILNEAAT
jgi:hypothetical protein